jgi:N-acetylglucosaminyldiphosphoundecaprenol N-acetyl-beta-D-mannosaminyltransferase
MTDHVESLNASVLIGVGAAFDFLSGSKKQAPKWIQRSGFEWLFRLFSEPNRLWRRYIEYPYFLILVLSQILRLKVFPLENTFLSKNQN